MGDIPVVVMLAWAGWLAVPWSFSGLAQARAAAAAAAADAEPPQLEIPAAITPPPPAVPARPATAARRGTVAEPAWGIPAAPAIHLRTVRPPVPAPLLPPRPPAPTDRTTPDRTTPDRTTPGCTTPGCTTTDRATTDRATVTGRTTTTDQAATVERAVAVERARIAGEVHDAAGHGLAAIAMQAGLALVSLDDDNPEQARASLLAIRETSTAALAHLRAALDGIDPPGGDLRALIDGVRAAGLPVDVEPAGLPVPAHLRDTVHRVTREALTNVLRHAGPTRALVRVSDGPAAYVLEVADRGTGATGAPEGRGLAGLRARVTEAGGRLTAGPRDGGGFQVIARFPRTPS
ncbi:sensor histidine kinase [Nonomuraea sp. NPDC050783]|uniref:sensor histidine kinase n=1 Tax=Nonomuraea sp. NPDC050783 TaxID=3154634 RepID=UPI003467BA3C